MTPTLAEGIKLAARSHQNLVWERTRHVLRLRSALREFYPAALRLSRSWMPPKRWSCWRKAPDPDTAARLSRRTIAAAYARANRATRPHAPTTLWRILRADELRQPGPIQASFAAITVSEVAIIAALNQQIEALGKVVADHFGQHPAAESSPAAGAGRILGARLLGEFGDDPRRYADAKARKAYAGTAPVTKASGTRKIVLARYARNKRLGDAAQQWAFSSMRGSAGATRTTSNSEPEAPAIKQPYDNSSNRWIGILHGCLKTGTTYDEHTAWAHILERAA